MPLFISRHHSERKALIWRRKGTKFCLAHAWNMFLGEKVSSSKCSESSNSFISLCDSFLSSRFECIFSQFFLKYVLTIQSLNRNYWRRNFLWITNWCSIKPGFSVQKYYGCFLQMEKAMAVNCSWRIFCPTEIHYDGLFKLYFKLNKQFKLCYPVEIN